MRHGIAQTDRTSYNCQGFARGQLLKPASGL